jgi:CMP-N,N'-diacetyllegionaminic acid synthase
VTGLKMSFLTLIPARANSKGVPSKNLRPLAGKPLIAWSIGHAKASSRIDRVVVSTDGPHIAEEARKWGAEVPFLRPKEISGDTSSTELAMIHAVESLAAGGYRPDFVVLLQPTSPLRRDGAIDQAIQLLEERKADSLVSAREIHPFLWKQPDNAAAQYDYRNRPMRQSIAHEDRLHEENGSIYITRTDILLGDRCRLGGKIVVFPMSASESIDIDTLDDFSLAEAVLKSGVRL